jgi:hypothetical protein
MKKLKLDMETLSVESFEAMADEMPLLGTVEARQQQLTPGCTPHCSQPPIETCQAGCTTTIE